MQSLAAGFKRSPAILIGLAVVVGFALGLLYGWVINPPDFVDATPAHLRADLQEDYLRMAIDSYLVNQNSDLAVHRWQGLGQAAVDAYTRIQQSPKGADPQLITAYGKLIESVLGSALSSEGAPEPAADTAPPPALRPAAIFGGLFALGVIVLAVSLISRRHPARSRVRVAPASPSVPNMSVTASVAGATPRPAQGAPASMQEKTSGQTDFSKLGLAAPITQTMTTYMLGDDLYDESFSIDSPGGEFLGEYGVGVSESIGVGDPKKVTALEIWLFDKNDINTATKVLMSQHAFNDTAIRERLERKGDLLMVEPQQQVLLETKTLQLLATVVDLEYGRGAMPQSSHFERLTLELAVWPK